MLTCGNWPPLAVKLSAANVNDHLVLPELLDRARPLRGRPGGPRCRITTLIADKSYDCPRVYDELRQRGSPATSRAAVSGPPSTMPSDTHRTSTAGQVTKGIHQSTVSVSARLRAWA
ncbi:transposase [Nocardia takedensis]